MSKTSTPMGSPPLLGSGAPAHKLQAHRKPEIVSLGEVLWDRFLDGARLGGAPANVAFHAARLGANSRLVSRVGDDRLGQQARRFLADHGVDVTYLQTDLHRPTGSVDVHFENGAPRYTIADNAAWDHITLTEIPMRWFLGCDFLCLGTLSQRTPAQRRKVSKFLRALLDQRNHFSHGPRILLDLNLRPPFAEPDHVFELLSFADIVKLNEDEAHWLSEQTGEKNPVDWLFRQTPSRLVALTHGAEGAELRSPTIRTTARARKVDDGDSVGAGDAFTASLAVSLAQRRSLPRCLERANEEAARVASQSGAIPGASS